MSNQSKLSRRDFLKLTGIAISAAALKACAPNVPIETATPTTLPPVLPTPTPVATLTSVPTPSVQPAEALFPAMTLVEAGSFQMGSIMDGYPDQQPIHKVNITRSFTMAKYAMTFE
jgi:formylglycine-generating enzyme required for sulfatase activity